MAKSKSKSESDGAKVNKSQAIRDLFAEDPKMDSKTVIERLSEQGIKVSPTMVYYVRSKQKLAERKVKRDRVAASSRSTASGDPVELVVRVKALAREAGGIGRLKQLVDLLAE
ncbi:MAG TPA: hypothetical protein VH092_16210 [Urbifossiella sp.]|nr:hypothetical protein [Urbifossiella sp.]